MSNGRTGYCKVCDSPYRKEIDKRLKSGQSAPTIVEWLATQDYKVTRDTLYKHTKHGARRPVTAEAPKPIAATGGGDFLDLVIEAGKQAVLADPTQVTLKNALDAQRLKDMRKEHQDDLRLELARLVMAGKVQGHLPEPVSALLPAPVEEGEFAEIG